MINCKYEIVSISLNKGSVMKYKVAIFGMLLGVVTVGYAERDYLVFRLPNSEILQKRFEAAGLHSLDMFKETRLVPTIIEKLASQEKAAMGVSNAIDFSFVDHIRAQEFPDWFANFTLEQMLKKEKQLMLEAALRDHPAALAELEERGVYFPAPER